MAAYEKGNYPAAMQEWIPLAEAGHAQAQYRVGRLYDRGEGVKEDQVKSAEWYKKSANQNVRKAQYNLGNMYKNGHGVPLDKEQSIYWYGQSARQGDEWAQLQMGVLLKETDPEESHQWLWKAVDQGNKPALIVLKGYGDDKASFMVTLFDIACFYTMNIFFDRFFYKCP